MNKTAPNGRDFDLLPGATLTRSAGTGARGTWQCLLNLIHVATTNTAGSSGRCICKRLGSILGAG
jgi:hypothetical protein